MRDNVSQVEIEYENDHHSSIRLIKMKTNTESRPLTETRSNLSVTHRFRGNFEEKFDSNSCKTINFSHDCSRATFYGTGQSDCSSVSGICRYSSRIHSIRFRLEHVENPSEFFIGIVTGSQEINSQVLFSPSSNGWCELDLTRINGQIRQSNSQRVFRSGDELSLILNCEKHLIRLEHHRTNRSVEIPIDLRFCPLPWKILVQLSLSVNSISILR